jgi:hypothetical protein
MPLTVARELSLRQFSPGNSFVTITDTESWLDTGSGCASRSAGKSWRSRKRRISASPRTAATGLAGPWARATHESPPSRSTRCTPSGAQGSRGVIRVTLTP